MSAERMYGLLACYDSADDVLAAARRLREEGYERMDAYTPFPVSGLAEALGARARGVRLAVLFGALVGGALGYLMQWYSAVLDYPLNIGGRPLHSWPSFMLVTFELAVLGGAVAGFLGMLALNRLPCLHHPLFSAPGFGLATRDRFFLCVEQDDGRFDEERTRELLMETRPLEVREVFR